MSVCSQVFRSGLRRVQSIDAVRYVAPSRNGVRRVEIRHSIHVIDFWYIQDARSLEDSPDSAISDSLLTEDISIWDPTETVLCVRGGCKDGRKASRTPGFSVLLSPSMGSAVGSNLSLLHSGFWRKLGFYFCLILVVNGLITVGYYTFDHCYGLFLNDHGKWSLKSDIYQHYHQLELVLNFPAGALSISVLTSSPRLCARSGPPSSSTLQRLHRDHARAQRAR